MSQMLLVQSCVLAKTNKKNKNICPSAVQTQLESVKLLLLDLKTFSSLLKKNPSQRDFEMFYSKYIILQIAEKGLSNMEEGGFKVFFGIFWYFFLHFATSNSGADVSSTCITLAVLKRHTRDTCNGL